MHRLLKNLLSYHPPHSILHRLNSELSSPIIPFYDKQPSHENRIPIAKYKQRHDSQLIFGIHPVLLGLRAGKRDVYKIFIKDSFWNAAREDLQARNFDLSSILNIVEIRQIKKQIVNVKTLSALCNGRPHQGVILECSQLPNPMLTNDLIHSLIKSSDVGISLFLDEVKDIMNFAGILRSAAFFSTNNVFLPTVSSCTPHPIISKISSGAMETVNFYRINEKLESIRQLREAGFTLIGTAGQPSKDVVTVDQLYQSSWLKDAATGPLVLVLGSEDHGVSEDILSLCHHVVRIPGVDRTQQGLNISSLNVSVATGIILHALYSNFHKPN